MIKKIVTLAGIAINSGAATCGGFFAGKLCGLAEASFRNYKYSRNQKRKKVNNGKKK